jgi:HEAT repeat protein
VTDPVDPIARAAAFAALGYRGGPLSRDDVGRLAVAVTDDPDARARAAALGALARTAPGRADDAWVSATRDHDAGVRRRAAELGPALRPAGAVSALTTLLDDADVTVVVAAAWAVGELGELDGDTVRALEAVGARHGDALAREAAVAALGALGAGLDTVLAACGDVPTVRRRAVLALAPFEDPAVDAALARALEDRDWQVRQAAEDLLGDEQAGHAAPVERRARRDAPSDRG